MAAAVAPSPELVTLQKIFNPERAVCDYFIGEPIAPKSREYLAHEIIEQMARVPLPLTEEAASFFLRPTQEGNLKTIPLITILRAFPHFRNLADPKNSPSVWPGESATCINPKEYYQNCFDYFSTFLKNIALPLLADHEYQKEIGIAYLETLIECAKVPTLLARTQKLFSFFHYFLKGLPQLTLEQLKTPVISAPGEPPISLFAWVHSLERRHAIAFLHDKCPTETPLVINYTAASTRRNIILEVTTLKDLLQLSQQNPAILSEVLESQYKELLINPSPEALSTWNAGLAEAMRSDSPEKTGRIYLKFLGEPLSIDNFVVLHRYNREGLSVAASSGIWRLGTEFAESKAGHPTA